MNTVRSIVSVFLITLLVLAAAGWNWAGSQPAPTSTGARIALGLCGLMAVGSLAVLWSTKRRSPTAGE